MFCRCMLMAPFTVVSVLFHLLLFGGPAQWVCMSPEALPAVTAWRSIARCAGVRGRCGGAG